METRQFEAQYQIISTNYKQALRSLYLQYAESKYGIKLGDVLRIRVKNTYTGEEETKVLHITEIIFRGWDLSNPERHEVWKPFFRFKGEELDEMGHVTPLGRNCYYNPTDTENIIEVLHSDIQPTGFVRNLVNPKKLDPF